MSVLLAVGVCFAAYSFLSVYALNSMRQEQLMAQQRQLRLMEQRRNEFKQQQALLEQVDGFARQARALGLTRDNWTIYDVNIQEPLVFDTAQEILKQCEDSAIAYFWPISLEVATPESEAGKTSAKKVPAGSRADVQLTVKGRFVARIQ